MLKIKKTNTERHFELLDLNQLKQKVIFPEKLADSQQAIQALKEKGELKLPTKSQS